jgi:hypothetical protein
MQNARLKTHKFATVCGLILLVMDPKDALAANIGFSVSLTPPPADSACAANSNFCAPQTG